MKIRMMHPSATSCSVDGTTYEADESGIFEVEQEHLDALLDHGFTGAAPLPEKPANERKANPAHMTTEALIEEANEAGIPTEGVDRPALLAAVAANRKAKAEE